MSQTYKMVKEFKNKYPFTITWWRLKAHSKLVDKYLNPDEKLLYVFAGQNDNSHSSILNTAVLALTNERIIVAQDRLIIGYKISSITPDLYNDVSVNSGLLWGIVRIDTVKEIIYFSNLSKKALPEIQNNISRYMSEAKKRFMKKEDSN
ncbi:MAG: PH domain-containing protein [Bacilli bacterium]|nr:PH domain-containing protein [Bacilli bacterium]